MTDKPSAVWCGSHLVIVLAHVVGCAWQRQVDDNGLKYWASCPEAESTRLAVYSVNANEVKWSLTHPVGGPKDNAKDFIMALITYWETRAN